MRIVLDTAAFISAVRSSSGAAAEVVRLALLERLTLLMDYKLVCEYRDVALRPQHLGASGRTTADINAVIDALESIAHPVFVGTRHRPLSQDKNDDMVLDVAINGSADVVITNNVKDFAIAAVRFGIRVQTPKEFLTDIRERGFIMQASEKKSASSKFPLRLMPSVRKGIESYSRREGVSLNQFINVTLAEKLAHLEHDEWLARRPQPSAEKIARALEVLDRPTQDSLAPGDELPEGYSPIRSVAEYPHTARIR